MTGRPVVAPPLAPARQVPVASPLLPPVLATAPPVDRWHYWRLFCAFGLLLAATGFVLWQGLAAGWDAGIAGFWAAVAAGVWCAGFGWAHRDYSAALRADQIARGAQAQTLAAELAEWQASLETERAVLREWSAHEHGPRRPAPAEPGPTLHPSPQEQQAAAVLARLEELTARVEALQPAPLPAAPERTRVAVEPSEQVTQHLDDPGLALLREAYFDGPAWVLMETAWKGDPITHEAMAEGGAPYMTSGQWKDLTALFGAAGVLRKAGQTRPWQLDPRYKVATEAACHAAVLDQLLAARVMAQTITDAGRAGQRA